MAGQVREGRQTVVCGFEVVGAATVHVVSVLGKAVCREVSYDVGTVDGPLRSAVVWQWQVEEPQNSTED